MRFMWQVSYTAEGARGVLAEGGSSRRALVEKLAKEMGGSIEAFYYAFGEHDVVVIGEAPDHTDAAALAMNVAASGAASIKTTVLLTPEEVDAASKKSVGYRPPGA
jgi:uncharacterized protein with GYD domain